MEKQLRKWRVMFVRAIDEYATVVVTAKSRNAAVDIASELDKKGELDWEIDDSNPTEADVFEVEEFND